MRRILKYQIEISDRHTSIDLAEDAKILTVAMQGLHLSLWALVEVDEYTMFPKNPKNRLFKVHGTGHEFYGGTYLGTVFDSRNLVWHVFEIIEERE